MTTKRNRAKVAGMPLGICRFSVTVVVDGATAAERVEIARRHIADEATHALLLSDDVATEHNLPAEWAHALPYLKSLYVKPARTCAQILAEEEDE